MESFNHLAEKYRNDPACLSCHVTGYGKPSGYVAGTEKDLFMVGCEACHGPGAQHIDAAQRFILAEPGEEEKIEKQIRETIAKTPSDDDCTACHTTQAHGRHPAYEGQPAAQVQHASMVQRTSSLSVAQCVMPAATRASYAAGYNVKTCGGCHYDQYKQWRAERHSALSAMLTAEHRKNSDCQQCHLQTDKVGKTSLVNVEPHHARVGVVCESCHGAALEHVRFNKQFISQPQLGPKLEQAARHSILKGKPASACVQCHVDQSHKEHPQVNEK